MMLIPLFSYAQTESPSDREARLRAELAQVEREQKETEAVLADAQQQSSSLKRDILILDTKIKAAELNIRAKNIVIEGLGKDITKKEQTITNLVGRIDRGRASLAQIMRKTNEVGDITLPEIILSQKNLSDVFVDIDTFDSIQSSLKSTFEEIRATKSQTETEKNTLDKRRDQEIDARQVIQQERKSIASNQAEKQRLLTISKGNEKTYSAILADKQRQAAQIRAALFALRDAQAIPFGDALKYATAASKVTGVRPAFVLAVLTQESNLGANVGSCYVTDMTTGNGIGKNTGTIFEQVMKAPRDTTVFKSIMDTLGRDWRQTPVSCPIGSATYYKGRGYGGGMGPAQFIPSTWVLFKDRIASNFNITTPDPWNPEHAFMASSIYLSDLGAISGSYSGEMRAACRYYGTGGSSCSYGRQVMTRVDTIQRTMIDPLQGV